VRSEQKAKYAYCSAWTKAASVLGIIAGILVARQLKTTKDLFDNRSNPRWAGRFIDLTIAL
jgi:hypothetical protein